MNDATEREFWLEIRRGFLLIVSAIDRRFKVGKFEPEERSMAPPANSKRT
jgi:hypothetical protein